MKQPNVLTITAVSSGHIAPGTRISTGDSAVFVAAPRPKWAWLHPLRSARLLFAWWRYPYQACTEFEVTKMLTGQGNVGTYAVKPYEAP